MSVRRAIESHLLDSSPQVRDAAVELIGKYMIDSPTVASEYYPKIAERIAVSMMVVAHAQESDSRIGHWFGCSEAGHQAPQAVLRCYQRPWEEDGRVHKTCLAYVG